MARYCEVCAAYQSGVWNFDWQTLSAVLRRTSNCTTVTVSEPQTHDKVEAEVSNHRTFMNRSRNFALWKTDAKSSSSTPTANNNKRAPKGKGKSSVRTEGANNSATTTSTHQSDPAAHATATSTTPTVATTTSTTTVATTTSTTAMATATANLGTTSAIGLNCRTGNDTVGCIDSTEVLSTFDTTTSSSPEWIDCELCRGWASQGYASLVDELQCIQSAVKAKKFYDARECLVSLSLPVAMYSCATTCSQGGGEDLQPTANTAQHFKTVCRNLIKSYLEEVYLRPQGTTAPLSTAVPGTTGDTVVHESTNSALNDTDNVWGVKTALHVTVDFGMFAEACSAVHGIPPHANTSSGGCAPTRSEHTTSGRPDAATNAYCDPNSTEGDPTTGELQDSHESPDRYTKRRKLNSEPEVTNDVNFAQNPKALHVVNTTGTYSTAHATRETKSDRIIRYRPRVRRVRVERASQIYVEGRYRKYSRELSQTRMIVDGRLLAPQSVDDFVLGPLTKLFEAEESNFHAAGREDVDVRMLGSGRPFIVQLKNAKRIRVYGTSDAESVPVDNSESLTDNGCHVGGFEIKSIDELTQYLNASPLVEVMDLKIGSQLRSEAYQKIQAQAETKTKVYGCLVWTSEGCDASALKKKLIDAAPLQIQQNTPLRVIHRRPGGIRPKGIHSLDVKWLSSHYFLLKVESDAGCYIKEFVHGDMGRTTPSIKSLLGVDEARILQLDVLGLIGLGDDCRDGGECVAVAAGGGNDNCRLRNDLTTSVQ